MSLADRHIETAARAAVVLAAWLWAIAASAQGRVRRWDWRKKDSVWVDITRFDIDERLYFGDMVASGTWGEPVRIYNEAGYIDIAGDDSVSYHFYERDRLGSVHAIVAEDGTLEQHTDYHSGGLPSSHRPLAAIDNRLHTGKEFQNFRGIALYDNLARLYDPLTTRFTTVAPLAERTPWLSPYTHCANNPLRNIDPTGKDVWLIDDVGKIVSFYRTEKYDRFFIVNSQGRLLEKSVTFANGTIEHSSSQKTFAGTDYDLYQIRGDHNGTRLFEFLAKNTKVEWSQVKTGIKGDKGLNFITTSHEKGSEAGMSDFFRKQLMYGYTLREDIHSHPSNFRYPSGSDWKSDNNDIRESAFIQDRTHNKVVFKIFIPIDNSYITFDDFSTIHDFKNKIERCANRY